MQKTKLITQFKALFLLLISLWSCDRNYKENGTGVAKIQSQIVLIPEDNLIWDFLKQRKVSLKYLDDAFIPVIIDFTKNTKTNVFLINTERETLELVYSDNSQNKYSYFLSTGDSIQIGLDREKPWLNKLNRTTSAYDDNLELLRNRELSQSNYTKIQDFYFLVQTNIVSTIPINLKEEIKIAKQEAFESLDAELVWLDSLRSKASISEKTWAFYSEKATFERDKISFFEKQGGLFNVTNALEHYFIIIKEGSEELQTVYLDEFFDFLLTQLTPEDPYEILHPSALRKISSPVGKRLLFKLLQQYLPRLSFREADEWLDSYGYNLENKTQTEFLKNRIEILKQERPDMEIMGIGNHLMTFKDLLDQKRGKYLYVDLWAAWCIPCIKSFPALMKLQENYSDQDIEVIHLSIDRNHKFWEELANKYGIGYPERSFITLNVVESAFLQNLDVALIPRNLIFDPNGKLIHPNAPGPETKEIIRFLNALNSE